MKYKVCTLIGTRPEGIKLAPLVKEIEKKAATIKSVVILTAQHRELLDNVLKLFRVKSDYDLDIMRPGQNLFDVTGRALIRLKPVLERENPDMLIIQGDTTTALIGALAAFYLKIPVAHVEAGLRTKDKYQPFPEEINRRVATVLADLHFAPTEMAKQNLLKEGIPKERIYVTGNTVIDAMKSVLEKDYSFKGPLERVDFKKNKLILITAHRRENWGRPLVNICSAIKNIISEFEDTAVLFSVHPNPEVQKTVRSNLSKVKRVELLRPLGYKDFVNLMSKVRLILTDSGGIQEEAPLLGKPVLVLRNITERQEAIISGTSKLVGTDAKNIFKETRKLLSDKRVYKTMTRKSPYGRGDASRKIVKAILGYLKMLKPITHRPVESIEPPLT